MGLRYRKSIKLFGGALRINFSKSGIGYSYGGKGARITKTANGRTRATLSVPGTGISYVTESGKKRKRNSSLNSVATAEEQKIAWIVLVVFMIYIGLCMVIGFYLATVLLFLYIFIVASVKIRKIKQTTADVYQEWLERTGGN